MGEEMTLEHQEAALRRIGEIDEMFESAKGWETWMVSGANDRERLVVRLRANGHSIDHKYQARTASGARTD